MFLGSAATYRAARKNVVCTSLEDVPGQKRGPEGKRRQREQSTRLQLFFGMGSSPVARELNCSRELKPRPDELMKLARDLVLSLNCPDTRGTGKVSQKSRGGLRRGKEKNLLGRQSV